MSFNPQTPQSPSQFSPKSVDPLSSMNSSMASITTLPTPAHSVNGSTQPGDGSHEIAMTDGDSPHNKRKRTADDVGDRESKKVHLEDPRRLGIENLHLDVGEKYLLCRTPHQPANPPVSGDLFEMFGLSGIAAEFARFTPNGEKNALRKTYKGHMKTLGINGHFDVVKREPDDPSGFMHLIHYPPEEWHIQQVDGKDIESGFSEEVLSSLTKAVSMAKGPIPKSVWDSAVLGDLALGNMIKKPSQDASRAAAPGTPTTSVGATPQSGKPLLPQAERMRRDNAKRSYQDNSFEGYGEGFPDDGETGYSTGDNDDRLSKQKRRKQNPVPGSSYAGGHARPVGNGAGGGSRILGV